MDITEALAPTSDQLDAIELVVPRTFTIDTGTAVGTRDGKKVAEVRLIDFPRVWRPSKGMLDLLAACLGIKAEAWVGHRVTVYNDRSVMFGREKTGGVRVSHLSHIDKARDVTIRANGAGRTQLWHVEPLPDDVAHTTQSVEPTQAEVDACTDVDTLRAMWQHAGPDIRALIQARVADLTEEQNR